MPRPPLAGTWPLNVARPQQGPNNPAKALIVVITEKGDQIETVLKGVLVDGTTVFARAMAPSKGGVQEILEGGPPAGDPAAGATVTVRVIDDWTWESTTMRDGKLIGTARFVVSKDGRTQTATFTGTDPQGRPFKNVVVLDKQ